MEAFVIGIIIFIIRPPNHNADGRNVMKAIIKS